MVYRNNDVPASGALGGLEGMRDHFTRRDMPAKSVFHRHIARICRRHRHIVALQSSPMRVIVDLEELAYGG